MVKIAVITPLCPCQDGVKNWTAMDSVFTGGNQGIIDFVKESGWLLTAHNRYWSNDTDYAMQNGGSFR